MSASVSVSKSVSGSKGERKSERVRLRLRHSTVSDDTSHDRYSTPLLSSSLLMEPQKEAQIEKHI